MDGKYTSIVFSSEIRALAEQNSSFDMGVLRVCYTGENRNKSYISKEAIERAIPSIFNCPIVCRYDRDADTIGAHDVDVVRTSDGGLKMINTTQPVGVVPTGANYWWEEVTEDNGDVHEYIYVEALIWKRQEAYEKIRTDGITDESMEINIKASHVKDGIVYIDEFEFTAFCLLGTAPPCFESASLELFALDSFKAQMTEMMEDLRVSFNLVQTSEEADIDTTFSSKGGSTVLNDEIEMIEDQTTENMNEPAPAAEEFAAEDAAVQGEEPAPAEAVEEPAEVEEFALESQINQQLWEVLSEEKIMTSWGECSRYWMIDYDAELSEVYAFDEQDHRMYGFKYSMNGDNVVIDFASKSRKKWAIQDFDEGEQPALFEALFESFDNAYSALDASWSEKYSALNDENCSLKKFKADTEAASVFANFADLDGVEAFESLKNDHEKFNKEDLEEKCYAIRGRNGSVAQFSLETAATKVVVETPSYDDEPYGGLFLEYGNK